MVGVRIEGQNPHPAAKCAARVGHPFQYPTSFFRIVTLRSLAAKKTEFALFSRRVAFCRQPGVSAAASLIGEVTRLEDVCSSFTVSHTIV